MARLLLALVVAFALVPATGTAAARDHLTRPVAELFGTDVSYGVAGEGVNTATGNFTLAQPGLDLAGPAWGATYNSLDEASGPLGRGWSTSYSASLTVRDDGNVDYRADDGRVATFTRQADGSYRRPAGLDADLARPGP